MACPECGESVRLSKSLVRGSDDTVQKGGMPDECPECGADLSDEKSNGGPHRLSKGI